MVSPAFQAEIESRSTRFVLVAELYAHDTLPGPDGFDPVDALACLAGVGGIVFRGQTYLREVSKFSDVSLTDSGKFNNGSLTISNIDQWIAAFEFTYGIEGLFYVQRLISRNSVDLDDSFVMFTGRCEKAGDADKKQLPISAKELLGSTETQLPPRNYTTTDETGRRRNDPLFEGFPYIPSLWTVNYQASEPKGGIVGNLLGLEKKVTKTLQSSSHSALDPNKPVPIVLGRAQMQSQHIGYGDFGNSVAMLTGWADGLSTRIHRYANLRNVDPSFTPLIRNPSDNAWMDPVINAYLAYGTLGGTGANVTTPLAATQAPNIGLHSYSRTAWTYSYVNGSEVASDDAAPLLLSIIYGNRMPTCLTLDDWSEVLFSDNPVDHARFIVTDPYLLKVPAALIDDEFNFAERQYCDEVLVDEVLTDVLVLPPEESGKAGVDYNHWKSTGVVTEKHYQRIIDGDDNDEPWENEADYIFESRAPIENGGGYGYGDPTNPDPNPDAPTNYRRRYTSNVAFTETQKAIDALTNVIYPAARMYHTYSTAGKLRFNIKRPADNTLLRGDISIGATEVPVYDILPWFADLRGWVLVGSDTIDGRSEVRVVSAAHYTTAGNSITLTASGGVTASGATFTGGNNTNLPATASLTITNTATKTITIDGIPVIVSQPSGTTSTISGLIKDAINTHSILSLYVKASWTPGTTTVSLESKLGFLTLVSPLEFEHDGPIASPTTAPTLTSPTGGHLAAGTWKVAYSYELPTGETRISSVATTTVALNDKVHVAAITPPVGVTVNWFMSRQESSSVLKFVSTNDGSAFDISDPPLATARFAPQANDTGEEITRMDFVFSDRALLRTGQTRANILADSFKWPLGGRQSSVNQIIAKFREAVDDFRPTEIRLNDSRHQEKVGKKLPFELNLAAVDNYHQAMRLANGKMAEMRDADSFASWGAGQESLLVGVGMVGCVTDFGSGLTNYMVRIEEQRISWNGICSLHFTGRKYSKVLYSDDIYERMIGMPTSLNRPILRSEGRVEVEITGGDYELSRVEANAKVIEFTGTLTSDATVLFPDDTVREYVIQDSTVRGGFDVEIDTVSGSGPVLISPGDNNIVGTGFELNQI